MSETIAALGEAGLLRLVQGFCAEGIVGDDAAVLPPLPQPLVVTTDVLVEGVHFSDLTTPPHSVGWRAAAANLSDLVAMGATPHSLVIGLGLPSTTPVAWVEQVYQGICDCCPETGQIVGGDLARSPHRFLAITALGTAPAHQIMRRSQARAGDCIVVSGCHGDSRAGLELLLNNQGDRSPRLVKAHQYPQPRLDLLDAIAQTWQLCDRVGGMDSSDGLADALCQLCEQSGVGASLATLPLSTALQTHFPEHAHTWALYGGEDFQLVLAVPPLAVTPLLAAGCQIIGHFTESDAIALAGYGTLTRAGAFQHFL